MINGNPAFSTNRLTASLSALSANGTSCRCAAQGLHAAQFVPNT